MLTAARRPQLLVMSAVITLLALGHYTLYTYASAPAAARRHRSSGIGLALFGYGCGGLVGLALAERRGGRRPEQALVADCALMVVSLLLAAVIRSPAGIVAVVVIWGVAFGALPTLTQTVTLRAAGDATDAATALVNATMNIGIAGGALLGSRLLGFAAGTGPRAGSALRSLLPRSRSTSYGSPSELLRTVVT